MKLNDAERKRRTGSKSRLRIFASLNREVYRADKFFPFYQFPKLGSLVSILVRLKFRERNTSFETEVNFSVILISSTILKQRIKVI